MARTGHRRGRWPSRRQHAARRDWPDGAPAPPLESQGGRTKAGKPPTPRRTRRLLHRARPAQGL